MRKRKFNFQCFFFCIFSSRVKEGRKKVSRYGEKKTMSQSFVVDVVFVVVENYGNIKSSFSGFFIYFSKEETHKKGKKKKIGKLLCWLIDFQFFFVFAAALGDGKTMIKEFDFDFFFVLLFLFFYAAAKLGQIVYWLLSFKDRGSLLTFLGPRWRDLWQRINAVDPVSCHAFRDNIPNDLVYPMPISAEPDVCIFYASFRWDEKGRNRKNVVIKKFPIHINLLLFI